VVHTSDLITTDIEAYLAAHEHPPYEPPENPELRVDTVDSSPEQAAEQIAQHLFANGLARQR